jgi:hypothetical protein
MTVCNWPSKRYQTYCDLAPGHDGLHYFHDKRKKDERTTPAHPTEWGIWEAEPSVLTEYGLDDDGYTKAR